MLFVIQFSCCSLQTVCLLMTLFVILVSYSCLVCWRLGHMPWIL